MNHTIELTVVIPVRNEALHIGDLLESFQCQTLPTNLYEIVVVNGRSEDATVRIVNQAMLEMDNLRIIDNPGINSSSGRNLGVATAKGSYVLFIDGHCRVLHSNMLEKVLGAFTFGEQCLSRPQPQITDDVTPFQRSVAMARTSIFGHYTGSKIYHDEDGYTNPMSAGCAYRIDLYRELGGVDESFDACEDLEFNYRISRRGIRAQHSRDYTVGYEPRDSFLGLFRQMYRYGYGRSRLARKHRGRISILTAGLCLFSSIALMLPVVLVVGGVAWNLWLSIIISYGVVSGLAASYAARGTTNASVLQIWACFGLIHFGGGLGYLNGLVGGPSLNHVPNSVVVDRPTPRLHDPIDP